MRKKGSALIIGLIIGLIVVAGVGGYLILGGNNNSDSASVSTNGANSGSGSANWCSDAVYQGGMKTIGITTYEGKEVCQRELNTNGVLMVSYTTKDGTENWQVSNGQVMHTYKNDAGQSCVESGTYTSCT